MKGIRRWGPGSSSSSPSIVLIAVFVYGLIGWNVKVSFSDWRQAQETSGFATAAYSELFPPDTDPAWTEAVKHVSLFTGAFMVGTLLLGRVPRAPARQGSQGRGLLPRDLPLPDGGVVHRRRRRLALAHEPCARATAAPGSTSPSTSSASGSSRTSGT